jgi:hypothetical protein
MDHKPGMKAKAWRKHNDKGRGRGRPDRTTFDAHEGRRLNRLEQAAIDYSTCCFRQGEKDELWREAVGDTIARLLREAVSFAKDHREEHRRSYAEATALDIPEFLEEFKAEGRGS